jgi:hypothetical protein
MNMDMTQRESKARPIMVAPNKRPERPAAEEMELFASAYAWVLLLPHKEALLSEYTRASLTEASHPHLNAGDKNMRPRK